MNVCITKRKRESNAFVFVDKDTERGEGVGRVREGVYIYVCFKE